MKTIEEAAEDHVRAEIEGQWQAVPLKRAYLAGAKYALELGSLTLAEASQYTAALNILNETTPEQDAQFKAAAQAFLQASETLTDLIPE